MKDEVVLLEPAFGRIRLNERRSGTLQFFFRDAGGETLKVRVRGPAARELYQGVPVAGEGELENQADHAVVVVLNVAFEALTAFEDQGLQSLLDGRALVADVSRGLVLEAGRRSPGTEDIAQLV